MKEFIEKLIERLEKKSFRYFNEGYGSDSVIKVTDAIEIVNQLAEEHKGGWIPCSERLPEDDSFCIVTVEYPNNKVKVTYGWFDRVGICWYVGMHEMRTTNIYAWQPLPEPYKSEEPQWKQAMMNTFLKR